MRMNKMLALFVAGTLCCGYASFAEEAAKTEVKQDPFSGIPAEVAEINGQKITKDMVIAEITKIFPDGKLPAEVTADDLNNALPGIVKQVVMQKLFDAELAKTDIKPSAELVKEKLNEELAKMDPGMMEMFRQQLQMQGKTPEEYIDEMAKEPMAQKQLASQVYLEKYVIGNIKVDQTVTPEEVKKYYDENKSQFTEPADEADQIRASHILFATDENASEEELKKAEENAKSVLEDLKKDPSKFEELARIHSGCPSSARGGALGAFIRGQMVPEFDEAVFALNVGDLSTLVKTRFGYHIIRRDASVTETKEMPFEMVKGDIENYLKSQKMGEENQLKQKAVMEFFEKLEKDNHVKYYIDMPADAMM